MQKETAESDEPDGSGGKTVTRGGYKSGIHGIAGSSVGRNGRDGWNVVVVVPGDSPACGAGLRLWRIAGGWRGVGASGGVGSDILLGVGAGRAGPCFAEAEALAEVVETEWVRERSAVAAGTSGVVRLDDLIEDPTGDEEAKDTVFVGEADEDGEDDEMDDAFGVLAVVHGADAGDEAEQSGEAGVGFARERRRWRRRDGTGDGVVEVTVASRVRIGATGRRWCSSGEFGGEAGFTEDSRADDAGALLAEWLAAVLAKRNMFTIRMV